MRINTTYDHHMHTRYSDGSSDIETIAVKAISIGLEQITITDHMPLPFKTRYAMDMNQIDTYRQDIRHIQDRYSKEIKVHTGLEIEFIPEIKPWIDALQKMGWDHLIASVHSLMIDNTPHLVNGTIDEFKFLLFDQFDGDMESLCHRYFKTLQQAYKTGWFDFAGHLDVFKKYNKGNIYFNDKAAWYRKQVSETLDILKQTNMSMEINTAGLNQPVNEQYPSLWIIKQAIKRRIPIHLSSDSHKPDTLGQHFNTIADLI